MPGRALLDLDWLTGGDASNHGVSGNGAATAGIVSFPNFESAMMNEPLLSIIIPTHERSKYLIPTVKSLLSIPYDIEIVVSDSSQYDHISAAIAVFADSHRVKIIRPGTSISVVDNFNIALKASSGKFVAFIGDDDFVSDQIYQVAVWAKKNNVDAIKFTTPVLYYWPDFLHQRLGTSLAGSLHIKRFDGSIRAINPTESALAALDNFGGGVLQMPRAYCGLIARKLVQRIDHKYGALFGGVSPDIYSSYLISFESSRSVCIDYPVIIPGSSGQSTAGLSANGKHIGLLRDNPHIKPFKSLIWDSKIPEFYSVPTVWSFSLLQAVNVTGAFADKVNFLRLYLKCFVFYPQYRDYTSKAFNTYRVTRPPFILCCEILKAMAVEIMFTLGILSKRIISFLFRKSAYRATGLVDSCAAKEFLIGMELSQKSTIKF